MDTQFLFSSRKEGRGYRLYYQHTTPITRCWFQTYFCSPLFGNHSHFDSYFTIGLKPPNLGTPLKFHIDIHIDTKTDGLEKIYLLLNMAILAIYVEFQGRYVSSEMSPKKSPKDLQVHPALQQMRFNQLQEVEDIKRVFSARPMSFLMG